MKKLFYLNIVLILLALGACGGLTNGMAPSGETTPVNNGVVDPTPDPISSTIIGNPTLTLDISGRVFLTSNASSNNFKSVVNNTLQDVLNFSSGTTSELDVATQNIPAIKNFALSASGEMVALFQEPAALDSGSCLMAYATNSTLTCIKQDGFDMQGTAQFDAAGNVYFFGTDTETGTTVLNRWDPATQTTANLINQNITLTKWLVHADGRVFMSGSTEGSNFFRVLNTDGSLVNILNGDATINDFGFADAHHLLVQAENVRRLPFPVSINGLCVLDSDTLTLRHAFKDIVTADLNHVQLDNQQRIYIQNGDKIVRMNSANDFTELFLSLSTVDLFLVQDSMLFVLGQSSFEKTLVALDMNNETSTPQTLLTGYEIYHLVYQDGALYFDALNYTNNTLSVFQWDIENQSLMDMTDLDEALLQLESLDTVNLLSFVEESALGKDEGKQVEQKHFKLPTTINLPPTDLAFVNSAIANPGP